MIGKRWFDVWKWIKRKLRMPREDHFQDLTYTGNISPSETSRTLNDLVPRPDNDQDLGKAAERWRDLFLGGTATFDGPVIFNGSISGVSSSLPTGTFYFPGTATGLASAPSTQPGFSVVLSGGSIADGTYYFKTTNWNRNGETTGSPTRTVTVSGGGGAAKINIGNADFFYLTGAPGYRVYCSNDNVTFYRQTPNPVVADFMIDTFTHYNSLGSHGARLTSLTFSGTQIPTTNTATIPPLQVALNATRRAPTGTSAPVPFGTLFVPAIDGTVNPSGQFSLTTPLVATRSDHIIGSGLQSGLVNLQSRIFDDGTWNNSKLGAVMVFGGDASISDVGIQGVSANSLMYLAGVGFQGGNGPMVVENVTLRAPDPTVTGIQVAAFKRSGAAALVNTSNTGAMLAIPPAAGIGSVTLPAQNVTAGNLLVCTVRWGGNGSQTITSVSDTAGNTYTALSQFSFGTERMQLFYVSNALGNAANQFTANFSASNFFVTALCDQFSGIVAAAALDVSATGSGLGSGITSSLFTTTNANDLIYGALEAAVPTASMAGTTWTAGSGYTLAQGSSGTGGASLGSQYKSVSATQTDVTASASYSPSSEFIAYVGVGIQYDVFFRSVAMSGGVYNVEFRNAAGANIQFVNGRWDGSGEGFVRNLVGWIDPDNGDNDIGCAGGGWCNALSRVIVKGVRTESGHGILWDVRNVNFTLDSVEIADQAVRNGTDSILRMGCTVESGGSGGNNLTMVNTGPGTSNNARVGTFVFSDGTCNTTKISLVGDANVGSGGSTGISIGLDANNVSLGFVGIANNPLGSRLTFNPTPGSTTSIRAINVHDNSQINYFGGGQSTTGGEDSWSEIQGRLVFTPFTGTSNIFSRAGRTSLRNNNSTTAFYKADDTTSMFSIPNGADGATNFALLRNNLRIMAAGGANAQLLIGPSTATAAEAAGGLGFVNNALIAWRNAAGNADIGGWRVNTSDEMESRTTLGVMPVADGTPLGKAGKTWNGVFGTGSFTGQVTSTLATGTAPFSIASTTNVPNLNASSLSGATFAAPGAIGGGTPSSGTFTTVSASTSATVGSGTAITKVVVYTPSLTPAAIAANTSAEQTFTVTGVTTADTIYINPPSLTAGTGIVSVRITAADTIGISWGNFTAGSLTPPAGTYRILAVRN